MTTISWYSIRGSGDPVNGNPAQFDAVADRFETIKGSFDRFGADFMPGATTSAQFQGEAALAFFKQAAKVNDLLGELPGISGAISGIFRSHAERLRALENRANDALARAQTHWNAIETLNDSHAQATRRLAFVDDQLEYLEAQGVADPAQDRYWSVERVEAIEWASNAASQLKVERSSLGTEVGHWQIIRDAEIDLDEETADALRGVDLGEMGDPSTIEQIGGAIADAVRALADFADYVFSMDFIEDLYKVLDVILTVLSVVAVVLMFIPGVNAIAAVLAVVIAVLAVVKAVMGLALYADGRITGWELVIDVASAFLSVVGAGAAVKTLKGGATALKAVGVSAKNARLLRMASKGIKISKPVELLMAGNDVATTTIGIVWKVSEGNPFDDVHLLGVASRSTERSLSNFDFYETDARYRSADSSQVTLASTGW